MYAHARLLRSIAETMHNLTMSNAQTKGSAKRHMVHKQPLFVSVFPLFSHWDFNQLIDPSIWTKSMVLCILLSNLSLRRTEIPCYKLLFCQVAKVWDDSGDSAKDEPPGVVGSQRCSACPNEWTEQQRRRRHTSFTWQQGGPLGPRNEGNGKPMSILHCW